jgi:hypothetical protein
MYLESFIGLSIGELTLQRWTLYVQFFSCSIHFIPAYASYSILFSVFSFLNLFFLFFNCIQLKFPTIVAGRWCLQTVNTLYNTINFFDPSSGITEADKVQSMNNLVILFLTCVSVSSTFLVAWPLFSFYSLFFAFWKHKLSIWPLFAIAWTFVWHSSVNSRSLNLQTTPQIACCEFEPANICYFSTIFCLNILTW